MLAVDPAPNLLGLIREINTLAKIEAFEVIGLEMPQVEVPVVHRFCEGVYIREATLPAGMFAIGHAHTQDCLNVVLSGSVSVLIEGVVKRLSAGAVFVGKAFDRKAGFVHEESRWQTIHATKETDLEKLEEIFLVKSQAFVAHEHRIVNDRLDYQLAIAELGFTHEQVRSISENTDDMVNFGCELVFLSPSKREGVGLFARQRFSGGDMVAVASIGGMRTDAGRYTNHSATPNAIMQAGENGTIYIVAKTEIPQMTEVLVDYRQAKAVADQRTKELSCQL